VYYFQIVDWYAASFSIVLLAVMECMVMGWIYGQYAVLKKTCMLNGSNTKL
jgi:hypothetical protein